MRNSIIFQRRRALLWASLFASISVGPLVSDGLAASGTWTNVAGGLWSTAGNWQAGNIANGANSTADFSTLNITGTVTANLDSSRTIGFVSFDDTTGTGQWVLDDNGLNTNVLTLSAGVLPTINTLTDSTIAANLGGTQGFGKLGTSQLNLTANNSNLTGTVSISAGTLSLGNGGTTGNLSNADISNNLALLFNRSNTMTYDGVISGSGTVTKLGTGTLILTGNNTSTGPLSITSGTVQFQGAGNYAGNITNTTGLTYANSSAITVGSNISGASVNMTNSAQVTFTGAVSSSNILLNGTANVQFGNGGVPNTIPALITNNASLSFSHSNNSTYAGTISGTGELFKVGANTLTLTADNTMSGITTINGGTLQFGNGGTTGSLISPTIALNAALIVNRSNDYTYAGSIIFGGTVTKLGSGALTYTGNNTYTGLTTVSAGTLNIGAGGTSGSMVSSIDNSGTVQFNRSDTSTYSGSISGTGSVVKSGAGTIVLTGALTHTGTTAIAGGTMTFEGAGNISGTVTNNSAMRFANNTAITLSALINGTGTINFASASAPTITGTLSTTGSVTVAGLGGVVIGNGGTLGAIFSNIVNSSSVTVNRSSAMTYGSIISGPGSLTKNGAGTLAFTGSNTYAGTTTINGGAIQIGTGGTTGSLNNGAIVNNSVLNFSRSNNYLFSGAISGTGSVGAIGTGTITLAGANTYSGSTSVANGTLSITGTYNPASPGALSVTGTAVALVNGGNATFSAITASNLSVTANGRLKIKQRAGLINSANVVSSSLSINTGGQLDITNNAVLVQSTDTGNTQRNTFRSLITSGMNGFDNNGQVLWNGPGIVSSTARANNVAAVVDVFTIGIIKNRDLININGGPGIEYGPGNPWLGTVSTVGTDDILIRMTYSGDTNLDGTVTIDDYNNIDGTVLGLTSNFGWVSGDFDFNGVINIDDYNAIDTGFLYQGGHLTQSMIASRTAMFGAEYVTHLEQVAAGFASVPEPASVALLAIGGLSLLKRNRRVR